VTRLWLSQGMEVRQAKNVPERLLRPIWVREMVRVVRGNFVVAWHSHLHVDLTWACTSSTGRTLHYAVIVFRLYCPD